jgi:transposase
MKGLMLTRFERGMLEQERDLARANGNLDLFLKTSCVLRVSEGHFQREVADMFGVPLRTLESWIEQYRNSGMSGLIKGPYSGKQSRLTPDQLRELAGIIEAGPETAGFETGIWTAVIVKSLVKVRFGVSYSLSQVRRILRKLRFSVQVPRRVPSKEDPEEQKDWIEKDLPEIEKEVRSDDGVSLYQDEASFQQSGTLSHTWCVKGKGCEVKSFPTRKRVKAFGAIKIDEEVPKWHFRFEKEKFNGESFIALLRQLTRYYQGKKVHLITDNVPYHKAPNVRKWVETNSDKIKLHFLPKYSPKLNATEYVWRKVKRMTTHNRYFETVEDLAAELFRRFNRFQGNPASLRSTIAGFT